MKVALISCTKAKKDYLCSAREMYSESNTFRLSLEYAEKTCDKIFILSAKHGLLDLEDTILPYDETLVDKPVAERKRWAEEVISRLKEKTDLEKDQFIILAGQKYNEFLLDHIKNFQLPLEGLTMFKRVPKLKELIEEVDERATIIHNMAREMSHYSWNEIDDIEFENGIYMIFKSGEFGHAMDRVVRVGTHRADGRLKARLKDHYFRKNKDGSIFRKNIGLALLNKDQDEYLDIWGLNTSNPKIKEERLRIEEGLIAILSKNKRFKASNDWLGNYHPDSEIRESYLWNKQGLKGKPLSLEEVKALAREQASKDNPESKLVNEIRQVLEFYESLKDDELYWGQEKEKYNDKMDLYLRLERAVFNQIENGLATDGRYAIWMNDIRELIMIALEDLESGNHKGARKK
ncbi:DUF6884 domain-containing protein [Clostridium cochlearium]|uniref:DUF6884 domain-containing protein n=1 Tax=Clostridium cochlearium TaxID=1494 RepID=UPI001570FFA3|nr:DUF6884 domain-containing protein [Clostridium cochlearium]MBV1818116.1 hypothetical protein [Bacteroidales bacterium MSK.15.36]MCG4580069.1 hypothetical protein [Clostridium cochlearium]NSJ90914.1 hypothetical protein [Coprococcus sp. MSK.21.13]